MADERILMSIRQYVDNPTGKGTAYLAKRATIKQGLNMTFIKLLQTSRQHFFAIPYIYPNGDILLHIKVPSEEYSINKIVYDVLFFIEYDEKKRPAQRNIQVFSNSPSFLFTYAYVYFHSGLIIPSFVQKLPEEAKTQPPVVRNPVQSLGYEKSTYIAARYILDGFVLSDKYLARFGKPINPIVEQKIVALTADPEVLVELYAHARDLQVKKHRKDIDHARRKKREDMKRSYTKLKKQSTPKKTGFIVKKAPKAKINAKMAKKKYLR